ncbi:MAG: TIGR01777 family oxidoreductase [Bacteroidota bacterium]
MKHHILITGATGMIGKILTRHLMARGHSVAILARKPIKVPGVQVYLWNVEKGEIDVKGLHGVTTIVHLAGEGIADKKWTKERKQKIIDSRVDSTKLLYDAIASSGAPVKNFIASSAVGFYGDRADEVLTEDSAAGSGFLAKCCTLWETAVDRGVSLGLRVVKIRTGFVLGREGGALPALERPIRFFAGAPLGTGKQWVPWIHVDDIVGIFVNAIEDGYFSGAYNGSAPYPVTNKTLTKAIAGSIGRPLWPFNVPEKILEMILGKMSAVTTISTNTSAQKVLDAGYKFQYTRLEEALAQIYKK